MSIYICDYCKAELKVLVGRDDGITHRCPECLCVYIFDEPQPPPQPNASTPIVELVTDDLRRRMEKGIKTYGTPLQAHNGRDALKDAYEECLDMACYLRQAIEERAS